MSNISNPVVYFEIPVNDFDRAVTFYTKVFEIAFEIEEIDGYQMALFPTRDQMPGISGALAKGDIYIPTKDGTLIYFRTEDIDGTLERATQYGGNILYPKTSNGDLGFVAEIADSEGNRIGLHMPMKKA